jgi:hypothetical protein
MLGIVVSAASFGGGNNPGKAGTFPAAPLPIHKCQDFNITGDGSNGEWNKSAWTTINKLDTGGINYRTRFKILYSTGGIYLLFEGEDSVITTQFDKDFQDLYKGDVFEAFFHPDTSVPIYFEYEINHLNKELVLLIANIKGKFDSWAPVHYEKERKVSKMVKITGGKMKMGAAIKSWTAELFIPYALFSPLGNVPPKSGTIWNANFYRLDYDSGNMIKYAWTPIDHSFHEFEKFQQVIFE